MKNPKLAKSFVVGAMILAMTATGATVWASTNSTLKTLPDLSSAPSVGNENSASASLSAEYSTYVLVAIQNVQNQVEAGKLSTAIKTAESIRSKLQSVNRLIQKQQTSAAEQSLVTATAGEKRATSHQNASTQLKDTKRHPTTSTNNSQQNQTSDNGKDQETVGHDVATLAVALQDVSNTQAQISLEKNITQALPQVVATLKKLEQEAIKAQALSRVQTSSTPTTFTKASTSNSVNAPVVVKPVQSSHVSSSPTVHTTGKKSEELHSAQAPLGIHLGLITKMVTALKHHQPHHANRHDDSKDGREHN